MLCKFCVDQEWLTALPPVDIKKLKTGDGRGFYTWTRDDFAKFERKWSVGTMERLAYEIFFNTGIRRGDAHRFGKGHVKLTEYSLNTNKTGIAVEGDITPRLLHAIQATKRGELIFLQSSLGRPFASAAALGNWFGDACRAAGVPGNAHGIRKGVASALAEEGMTEAQMNSFFGWSHTSKESATYIARASRKKMAKQGANILSRTFAKGAG